MKGLAQEGATVIVHGRDAGQAKRVERDISKTGGRARSLRADLTVDAEIQALIDQLGLASATWKFS